LFLAAKSRDNVSLQLVEEIGVLNAIGFANAINAYDPSLITVGGTVTLKNKKMILSPIKARAHIFSRKHQPNNCPPFSTC
jgi:predicted NBD/HSP70 family sugar kinase